MVAQHKACRRGPGTAVALGRGCARSSQAWLTFAVLAVLSAGCTELAVGVVQPTALSRVIALSRPFQGRTYRLGPGDQLTVRCYFNPQLDEDVQVRPDGDISLSLIGELKAVGKTAQELSAEITRAYSRFFVKSTSVVIVRRFTGYRVFTAGELHNPGQFDLLTSARTVLESISASGGVTNDGTLTQVILVRRLPGQSAPMVAELDLADAISGADPKQNLKLMPDDFIYVPKSGAADFNLAMQLYVYRNLNLSTSASVGATYNLRRP